MLQISDNPGSDGYGDIEGQDGSVGEIDGWQIENPVPVGKTPTITKDIIDYACLHFPLERLFQSRYKLEFEERYSPSGWSFVRSCPFPDHRDSTPSFHYNKSEDRFWCFGCSRGGRSVHFVSHMDRISYIDAAEIILDYLNVSPDFYIEAKIDSKTKIDELLLDFSNTVYGFIKENPAGLEYAERITSLLDVYMQKHLPRDTLSEENIAERIRLLKKKLASYG